MRTGWTSLLLIITLALGACSTYRKEDAHYYHVIPGDTLYSIAWRYGLDYREVARWNGVKAPDYTIFVGQRIALLPPSHQDPSNMPPPRIVEKGRDRQVAAVTRQGATSSATKTERPAAPPPRENAKPTVAKAPPPPPTTRPLAKPAPRPQATKGLTWLWPTDGSVARTFAPSHGRKGIDVQGQLGQPVVAAAEGDVVYSGKGLIGYGNLIIIKHNSIYLSAYGHNRRLLVKEGDRVKAGEKIAEMGQTSKTGSILHFEIRRNGTPVNPIKYLPSR